MSNEIQRLNRQTVCVPNRFGDLNEEQIAVLLDFARSQPYEEGTTTVYFGDEAAVVLKQLEALASVSTFTVET